MNNSGQSDLTNPSAPVQETGAWIESSKAAATLKARVVREYTQNPNFAKSFQALFAEVDTISI